MNEPQHLKYLPSDPLGEKCLLTLGFLSILEQCIYLINTAQYLEKAVVWEPVSWSVLNCLQRCCSGVGKLNVWQGMSV